MPSRSRGRHGGVRRVPPPTQAEVQALADEMGRRAEVLGAFTLTAAWSGLRLECEVGRLLATDVVGERCVMGPGVPLPPGVTTRSAALADDTGLLYVRRGKGGRARTSVIFEPGLSALRAVSREHGHIFRNALGYPWTRQAVNKHWVKARAAVGLEHVVFHDLRKFHATWLLDRGVSDIDVAIQLGHFDRFGRPDPELVRRVYGWPDPMLGLARVAAAGGATVAA